MQKYSNFDEKKIEKDSDNFESQILALFDTFPLLTPILKIQ